MKLLLTAGVILPSGPNVRRGWNAPSANALQLHRPTESSRATRGHRSMKSTQFKRRCAVRRRKAGWCPLSVPERPRRPSPWDEAVRPARQGRSSAWRFADQFSLVCCQNDLHESLFINYPRSLWTWCLQMCRCHTLIFDFVTTRVVQRACPLLTANDVKYWLFLTGLLMTKVLNSQCDSKQATYFNMIVMCAYHKRI